MKGPGKNNKNNVATKVTTKEVEANRPVYLLLDNIRSVYNVGSLFRTAETLGITEIYLAGCTPAPIDRFGRARPDFAKVALRAEKTLAWKHIGDDSVAFIKSFAKEVKKKAGRLVTIALEQGPRAVDYKDVDAISQDTILVILGNEVDGVSSALIDAADIVADIPMKGKKESLNVSVALGVALFQFLR